MCDGKWDCPHGIDESQAYNCVKERQCTNMFKCKNSIICIHIGYICNEKIDCPLGDDEYLCDLKFINCPTNCTCWTFAIKCCNIDHLIMQSNKNLPYHVIHIVVCSEMFTKEILQFLYSVTLLAINGVTFDNACTKLPNLQHSFVIDLSFNRIRMIQSYCFQQASNLKVIKMNDNMISQVKHNAFFNLKALRLLNLSNNIFVLLTSTTVSKCFELEAILIQNTSIKILDYYVFKNLGLKYFISKNYHTCCFMSSPSFCVSSTSTPWYYSCSNLLENNQIKMFFMIMTLIILCCNSFSLFRQVFSWQYHQSVTVSTIVVSALNVLDFSFGIYFLILWFADLYFQDGYAFNENRWKSSLVCFCAFSVSLHFSFFYPFLLVLLALLRFWTVIKPMSTKSKDTNFIKRLLCSISLFSIIIAISVSYFIKSFHGEIPFKLCNPFLDPSNSVVTIKILTLVVVIIQFICVFVIFVIYFVMMKYLKGIKNNLTKKGVSSKSYLPLYVQVCLSTLSNVLCWIPSGIIYLVVMLIDEYPINLIIWLTIVITPINSIINPVVFIVGSMRSYQGK